MQKDQIKDTFQKATAKIEELRLAKEENDLKFKTNHKYIDKVGYISEIASLKDLTKAKTVIDKQFNKLNDAAKELGIEDELAEEEAVETFLGYPKSVWDNEIQLALESIRLQNKIDKLGSLRKVSKKHLSEDDKFNLDFEKVAKSMSLLD